MRIVIALAAVSVALTLPSVARAVDVPNSINTPPSGAGTEVPRPSAGNRVREGYEANAQIGTGFSSTYGLGVGARAGYTFRQGIYVGGAFDYFFGNSTNDNTAYGTFFGADVGYKFFFFDRWEVRPHIIAGPGFTKYVNTEPFYTDSRIGFAVQPGLMAAYHFGEFYLMGDGRWFATPAPNTFALTVGAGVGF